MPKRLPRAVEQFQGLVELSFINRSLMWLSQCIYGLGERRASKSRSRERRGSVSEASVRRRVDAGGMARFRNSKLTLLLWKALSGFKTSVICASEGRWGGVLRFLKGFGAEKGGERAVFEGVRTCFELFGVRIEGRSRFKWTPEAR